MQDNYVYMHTHLIMYTCLLNYVYVYLIMYTCNIFMYTCLHDYNVYIDVYMRDIYVHIQDVNVSMQDYHVYMQDNYVYIQDKYVYIITFFFTQVSFFFIQLKINVVISLLAIVLHRHHNLLTEPLKTCLILLNAYYHSIVSKKSHQIQSFADCACTCIKSVANTI